MCEKYKLDKTYRGFQIVKNDGKCNWYLKNVYNGKYYWVRDYLYGKHYSLRVARQHINKLIKNSMIIYG